MNLSWVPRAFALVASILGVSSCALLFQGTTEQITVTSDPPGAMVTLNNGETRVTPFTITVPREQDLQFHFSKPGYQSVNLVDNSRTEPIIALDAFPFLIPWAIDAAAGAGYEHQQTSLHAQLEPEVSAGPMKNSVAPPQAAANPKKSEDNQP